MGNSKDVEISQLASYGVFFDFGIMCYIFRNGHRTIRASESAFQPDIIMRSEYMILMLFLGLFKSLKTSFSTIYERLMTSESTYVISYKYYAFFWVLQVNKLRLVLIPDGVVNDQK